MSSTANCSRRILIRHLSTAAAKREPSLLRPPSRMRLPTNSVCVGGSNSIRAGRMGMIQMNDGLLPTLKQQQHSQQVRSMVVVTQSRASDPQPPLQQQAPLAGSDVATTTTTTPQSSQQQQQRLHVTPACYQRIHQLVAAKRQQTAAAEEDDNDDHYLRVFVDAGGCSGFSYQFELDSEPVADDDIVFAEEENTAEAATAAAARVVVDEGSLELIQGSTVDYVQEMIKSGFEVHDNPQSESACGCGSSFALKSFAANPALD